MADTVIPASSRGRAVETRLAFETTANVLPTAGWKRARFYTLTAGMDRPLVPDPQLGVALVNQRDAGRSRQGLPGGSLRRAAPLNLTEVGYWLSSGFVRAAPTGADGDFVHVFNSGGDPSNLLSLAQKWEDGTYSTDTGVALAEVQITAAKGDGTGRMNMTLIGLGEVEDDAWPTGTVAAAAADETFSDWRWRALWNDVAVGAALNLDLNLNLGVERIQGLSGDEWPTQHHFGEITSSGSFQLYGRGEAFRELGRTGAAGKLTLEATHPADPTARYFRIEQNGVQFGKPQNEVSGPGQNSATFTYAASQDATTNAVKVTVANGLASY